LICFSGVVNLSQPLIDAASHAVFHDNPIPINIILSTLGFLIGVALVSYVWVQVPQLQKIQEPETSERSRLLPEVREEEV
jgi:hypothetical protein